MPYFPPWICSVLLGLDSTLQVGTSSPKSLTSAAWELDTQKVHITQVYAFLQLWLLTTYNIFSQGQSYWLLISLIILFLIIKTFHCIVTIVIYLKKNGISCYFCPISGDISTNIISSSKSLMSEQFFEVIFYLENEKIHELSLVEALKQI